MNYSFIRLAHVSAIAARTRFYDKLREKTIEIPFMAIRKITEYPGEVLAKIGLPVTEFDSKLAELCADMFDTMYEAEGVGLAAPQIGLNLRLFVMDCDGIKLIAANPEIVHTEGEQSSHEGCLSVGKVPAVVVRPMKARLRAQNEKGEWFESEAEGYAARAFMHETDHCNGKLFIDHLPKMRRDMVVKRFKKEKTWK
jgi:peptide deformylase